MKYTIEEKIKAVNEELGTENENIPAVSLSVGVAFSDRENSGESIFKEQIKLSIMSKKMEEMVVSSIKKCMQEILQNIG